MSPLFVSALMLQAVGHCRVEAWAESKTFRSGKPFTVAIRLTPDPGWHTYWRNPGDSGSPTTLEWKLPPGWKAGPVEFPVPDRIPVGEGLVSFGYEGPSVLLQTLTPPRVTDPRASNLVVTVSWVACKEECVTGSTSLEIRVRPGEALKDEVAAKVIGPARSHLPSTLPEFRVRASVSGEQYRLDVTRATSWTAEAAQAVFIPLDPEALDHSDGQGVTVSGPVLSLVLKPSGFRSSPLRRLRGLLVAPNSYVFLNKTRALVIDAAFGAS